MYLNYDYVRDALKTPYFVKEKFLRMKEKQSIYSKLEIEIELSFKDVLTLSLSVL